MIKLSDLFHIEYGNQVDLNKLKETSSDKGVRFISRSSENLGFQCYVVPDENLKIYNRGDITVTLGGTYLLSAFVQPGSFITGQNIKVLTSKEKMSDTEKYFYCYAISHNRFRYTTHGREANKTLDDLPVPSRDELPKWLNIAASKVKIPNKEPFHNKVIGLNDRYWSLISINDIFHRIEKCKCSNASSMLTDGDDIYYIGAKKSDNGIMNRVRNVKSLVSKGNCIVFIGDGQGSIGYTLYQETDFIGSSTLTCAYSRHLNKYTALFLVTILDLERYRYSFGRKYGKEQVKKTMIKLPTTPSGDPDWEFMEYYIKSLPFSGNLKEVSKADSRTGLSDEELAGKYESGEINMGNILKPILK